MNRVKKDLCSADLQADQNQQLKCERLRAKILKGVQELEAAGQIEKLCFLAAIVKRKKEGVK